MIYQGVGFYLISTELYVKWFINYCIVKYFSLFLLEKLNIIRTSMNFATIKLLNRLNLTRVSTENTVIEKKEIEEVTNSIDADSQLVIIPFAPVVEELDSSNSTVSKKFLSHKGITYKSTIHKSDNILKKRASFSKCNLFSFNKMKSANVTKRLSKNQINRINGNSTLTTNMTLDTFISKKKNKNSFR